MDSEELASKISSMDKKSVAEMCDDTGASGSTKPRLLGQWRNRLQISSVDMKNVTEMCDDTGSSASWTMENSHTNKQHGQEKCG